MAELTITFLGTGTSLGVPMIGCDCRICRSTDSRDKRTRSSIYVEAADFAWVIDTGPDFRTQALREGVRRIDAVVFTHSHTDHIMGLDDLRPFCFGEKELPVYASPETMRDLTRVFVFAFNGENRWPGYLRPLPYLIDGPFRLGEMEVTPLPVLHGRTPVNGYLLRWRGEPVVAYLSDCKEVPAGVRTEIRGVHHLIVDALRYTLHPTHMNVDEALALARDVAPRQTWLTHLSHDILHAEAEAALPPAVRIAFDGLKIEI
jgi:phosphoribosyl 1,2-cyclic phosphate phosphodiesterase